MRRLIPIFLLVSQAFSAECPTVGDAQSILNRTLKTPFTVKSVEKSKVEGLCRIDTQEGETFFTDREKRYLIEGVVTEIPQLSFSEEEVKRFKNLTAFRVGNSGRTVYIIADPSCSVCREKAERVKELLRYGFSASFVLAPITHEGKGFKSAVSIICDRKGLSAFSSGYVSHNICDAGKLKTWSVTDMLKRKGITSVPLFITEDGRVYRRMDDLIRAVRSSPQGEP